MIPQEKSAGKFQRFRKHSMHELPRGPYSHTTVLLFQSKPPTPVSAILVSGQFLTEVPRDDFK